MKYRHMGPALALVVGTLGAQQAQAQLFQPPQQFFTDLQTNGVVVGDINGDGIRDVVVTGCGCGFQIPSKVYVFSGQPGGTLNPVPFVYVPQGSPGGIGMGDVTGDGRPDLVMRSGSGIEVIPGNAAGGLDPSIYYPSNYAEQARLGDLDGDGKLDVIGLQMSIDGHVDADFAGIWHQNPAGSFDPQVLVPLPHGFGDDLKLADINGDGLLDVVDANSFNAPGIEIIYQGPGGTFSAPVPLSIAPGVLANQVAVGDVDGDGRKDIVATYGGWLDNAHVAIFRQNADGTFAAPVSMDTSGEMAALEVADVNNDGRADIVLLHRISLSIWLQTPTGLAAETSIALPDAGGHNSQTLAITDINGDGAVDIAYGQVGTQGALTVLYGVPPPPPPSNHPPVANPDSITITCDGNAQIAVLANDLDPDGDALHVTAVTRPANGTATITPNGLKVRYEPKRRFRGTDRFNYTISDGKGGTASATVTVLVK